jgi:hypothetical protein
MARKTRVLNMTREETLAARSAGPEMTDEEVVAQVRRIAKSSALDAGLTPEEVRVMMLEFPIPSEEKKAFDGILNEGEPEPNA